MDVENAIIGEQIIIKTEIKQENDEFPSSLSNSDGNEFGLINMSTVKTETVDSECEAQYYVTNHDLREIKTESSDEANGAAWTPKRKRKAKNVEKACQFCGKTFRDSFKLKKHIMDHTGERPFKCHLCDSAFKEKYSLTVHVKTHTGQRPPRNTNEPGPSKLQNNIPSDEVIVIEDSEDERPPEENQPKKRTNYITKKKHGRRQKITRRRPFRINIPNRNPPQLLTKRIVDLDYVLLWALPLQMDHSRICPTGKIFLREEKMCDTSLVSRLFFGCTGCKVMFAYDTDPRGFDSEINEGFVRGTLAMGGDRQFACPDCDKTFVVPSALKAHARTHSKEKPYVCPICGRGFAHSANLKPHMTTHSEELPFHCLECGKSFRTRKALLRHLKGHHANCTKQNCEFCSQFEKVPYKPRKYVKGAEKIRECPICLQTFRHYMTFKNHMRAHNNENYTCGFCNKSYLDRAALRVHLRNHTGETPYVCGVCGKKYKRGDSYRYHLSTHSDERKLFHCDICNQDYTHRSSLLKHKRHVHEDLRPFQCEICERSFKTPQVLKGHLRTHRNDNSKLYFPETCRICEKVVDKRGYKAHMNTHGIDMFKCKKCRSDFEGQDSYDAHKQEGCVRYKSSEKDTATYTLVSPVVDVSVEITEENNDKATKSDT